MPKIRKYSFSPILQLLFMVILNTELSPNDSIKYNLLLQKMVATCTFVSKCCRAF